MTQKTVHRSQLLGHGLGYEGLFYDTLRVPCGQEPVGQLLGDPASGTVIAVMERLNFPTTTDPRAQKSTSLPRALVLRKNVTSSATDLLPRR